MLAPPVLLQDFQVTFHDWLGLMVGKWYTFTLQYFSDEWYILTLQYVLRTSFSLGVHSLKGGGVGWACLNPGILIVHTSGPEVVMVLMLIVCGFDCAWRVRGAAESICHLHHIAGYKIYCRL